MIRKLGDKYITIVPRSCNTPCCTILYTSNKYLRNNNITNNTYNVCI